MQRIRFLLFSLSLAASAFPLAAQTVLSTDFSTADVRAYMNGEAINLKAGPEAIMRVNIGNCDGGIGHWCADPEAENFLVQVTEASGKRAVEMAGGALSKSIPPKISHRRGLNLQGSVVFTPLDSKDRTDFLILLNSIGGFTTGGATIANIVVSPSFALKYTGGSAPDKLVAGTKYRIDFSVDFSNPQQHTWEFTLYEGDSAAKPVFSSGKLNTRNPTALPDTFALHQIARVTGAAPLVRVHEVKLAAFEAAPAAGEPSRNSTHAVLH